MKRSFGVTAFCFFLLLMPPCVSAAELTLRNTEQCGAKVALAYTRDGLFLVEGWFTVSPGQTSTIWLPRVEANDIYAHVVYEYPQIALPIQSTHPTAEHCIQDTHFRYAGTPPGHPALRKAVFHAVRPVGDNGKDQKVTLTLGPAAK